MHKDEFEFDPTRAPSVFDIDVLRLARVYAHALLKAAVSADKVDDMQQAFDAFVGNPLEQRPELGREILQLISGEYLPRDKMKALIDKAFTGRSEPLFINFLQVLNDHERLNILRAVAAMYREARDKHLNRVRLQVRTAVPLTEKERADLAAMARERFHLEPILVESVDPDLLGGLQVQIGDRLVDLSVRRRLETIKNQMIERSSHEIQRRRNSVGSQV